VLGEASSKEAASEHLLWSARWSVSRRSIRTYEKDVGQDTAQHTGLNDSNFALLERNDGDLLQG
jgi:hypothetical protein